MAKKKAAKNSDGKSGKKSAPVGTPRRPSKTKVAKLEAPPPAATNAKAELHTPKAAKTPKAKKVSCIDAAAQVLAASKSPMTTKGMIEAIGAQGLWSSPGGKTPHATLYSAILREIQSKGKDARFAKSERGKFVANQ